jgi:2',3'-cyclic-nucleotide 2'-phosphodiesterase (5'-nucleotidase family)
MIREVRATHPNSILVDAGDFGSPSEFKHWMRTEFQWQMMEKLGYDVVTPGPNEMRAGLEPLKNLTDGSSIQVISANITDKAGNLIWPDHTLIERGGVTFGVTGVTDQAFYTYNLTKGAQDRDEFAFRNIKESLDAVLPGLRAQSDVVVLLLHTGYGDARRLLDEVSGVDVVVIGHAPVYKFSPDRQGEALVVQSGTRGQYLSCLELNLNDAGQIEDYRGEARPLGDTVALDGEYDRLIKAFNQKYDKLKEAAGIEAKAEPEDQKP